MTLVLGYISSAYSDTKRFQNEVDLLDLADLCLMNTNKNVQHGVWARYSWGISTKLPKFALKKSRYLAGMLQRTAKYKIIILLAIYMIIQICQMSIPHL